MASSTPTRPSALSPFESASGRQSPFRRQNSVSPATAMGTPVVRPSSNLSPTKTTSFSPEKSSPFVRRPSQMNSTATERPSSPFARPTSSLNITSTPSRASHDLKQDDSPSVTPQASPTRQRNETPTARAREFTTSPSVEPPSISLSPVRAPPTTAPRPPDSPFSQPSLRTIKQSLPIQSAPKAPQFTTSAPTSKGTYSHIPNSLLHSMRESFEVLDTSATGAITAAQVSEMLSQLGRPNDPAVLSTFFPPTAPSQLTLARYLDVLAGPLADVSATDELKAAFEAFDVDDSGQIDVDVLREALGGMGGGLSEKEIEAVLGEFSGRRAFGAKGLNVAKGKGEVFRYRDFMGCVSGAGIGAGVGGEVVGEV